MAEHWYRAIEDEIEFYLNFQQHKQEIEDLLKENETHVEYPVSYLDPNLGRIVRMCRGTEQQAINRIEKREGLLALLERVNKRIERLTKTIAELSEDEQDLFHFAYFDRLWNDRELCRVLGLGSVKNLQKAKMNVLKKVWTKYEEQRKQEMLLLNRLRVEERKAATSQLKREYDEQQERTRERKMFIESVKVQVINKACTG